jgi:hypothetical protein
MVLSNAERQRRWRDNQKQLRVHVKSEILKSPAHDWTAASETNKMQVVGPRQTVALDEIKSERMQAQAARDYNPTVNAIADMQTEMRDVIENYAPSPARATIVNKRKQNTGKYRDRPAPITDASSSLAIYNACLERLHALRSQFESSYEPLIRMIAQNAAPAPVAVGVAAPAAPAAPGGVQAAAPQPPPPLPAIFVQPAAVPARNMTQLVTTAAPASSSSGMSIDLSHVLASLPKTHRDKYTWLHDYITRHPDVIGSTGKGRLTIYGAVVEDALYTDVIRALYTNPRGGMSAITPGLPELVGALREIGVPRTLISSATARAQYALLDASRGSQRISQSGKGHSDLARFSTPTIKCLRIY